MTASKPITDAVLKSVAGRFWTKAAIGEATECWEWHGNRNHQGYGRLKACGTVWTATRIAMALSGTRVAPALVVCHRCDNPSCVNPAHLFVGTNRDNAADASAKGRLRGPSQHTHCKKGHPLTPDNRNAGANRGCRICRNERASRYRDRKRFGATPLSSASLIEPASQSRPCGLQSVSQGGGR